MAGPDNDTQITISHGSSGYSTNTGNTPASRKDIGTESDTVRGLYKWVFNVKLSDTQINILLIQLVSEKIPFNPAGSVQISALNIRAAFAESLAQISEPLYRHTLSNAYDGPAFKEHLVSYGVHEDLVGLAVQTLAAQSNSDQHVIKNAQLKEQDIYVVFAATNLDLNSDVPARLGIFTDRTFLEASLHMLSSTNYEFFAVELKPDASRSIFKVSGDVLYLNSQGLTKDPYPDFASLLSLDLFKVPTKLEAMKLYSLRGLELAKQDQQAVPPPQPSPIAQHRNWTFTELELPKDEHLYWRGFATRYETQLTAALKDRPTHFSIEKSPEGWRLIVFKAGNKIASFPTLTYGQGFWAASVLSSDPSELDTNKSDLKNTKIEELFEPVEWTQAYIPEAPKLEKLTAENINQYWLKCLDIAWITGAFIQYEMIGKKISTDEKLMLGNISVHFLGSNFNYSELPIIGSSLVKNLRNQYTTSMLNLCALCKQSWVQSEIRTLSSNPVLVFFRGNKLGHELPLETLLQCSIALNNSNFKPSWFAIKKLDDETIGYVSSGEVIEADAQRLARKTFGMPITSTSILEADPQTHAHLPQSVRDIPAL